MKIDPTRHWKRGDVHPETGKVFWTYDYSRNNPEQWRTAEGVRIAKLKGNINAKRRRAARRAACSAS